MEATQASAPDGKRVYRWPWFVLGAVILAVILAFFWMSREVRRMRQIRDANTPSGASTNRAIP